MTFKELKAILETTGYPVAYSHFNEATEPPFITYISAYSSNIFADNSVFHKAEIVQVELYTDYKDPAAEQTVEKALDESDIPWSVEESYIDSERLYQRIYEIGVY